MTNIYGYSRVSTADQAEHGQSLIIQDSQIEAAVKIYFPEDEIKKVFVDDGVSGSIALRNRVAGCKLIERLVKGDVVISTKLDRIFRNTMDAINQLEDFKTKGVRLFLIDMGGEVTGDGIGKMIFTILSAFAQFERDRLSERIRDQKKWAVRENVYMGGGIPLGYTTQEVKHNGQTVKILVPDPDEQQIVWYIKFLRARHKQSLEKIQFIINQKFGRKLGLTTVKRSLQRETVYYSMHSLRGRRRQPVPKGKVYI